MQLETQVSRSVWTRALGAVTVFLLLLTGAGVLQPSAAWAATGKINTPVITIVNDGTSAAPGDTADTDGLVGLGNKVSFGWSVTVNDLADGVMSQTLPEGWTWDEQSLITSGMHNPDGLNGYTSTYEISTDRRTVTVTLSSSVGSTGTQLIEFNTPTATVTRAAAQVGVVYTPELSVTDSVGTVLVPAASSVEVVAEAQMDLVKGGRTNNPGVAGTYDFGSGPVPAIRHSFYVALNKLSGPGQDNFAWSGPMTVADTFSITHDGAAAMGLDQAISLGARSHAGMTVALSNVDAAAGTFEVTFDSIPDATQVWTDIDIWVPRANVPNTSGIGTFPLVMSNVVSKPANAVWETTNGATLVDRNSNNNTQVRNYSVQDAVAGSWAHTWAYDLVSATNHGTVINGHGVLPGTEYGSKIRYRPKLAQTVGSTVLDATPVSDLNLQYRWNPSDSVLVPSAGFNVNAWNTATGAVVNHVEGTDYRVYYTTDATSVAAPSWTLRADFTGDIASVSGLRIEYIGTGGTFQPASGSLSHDRYSWQAVPHFTVVRDLPAAGSTTDLGRILKGGSITTNAGGLGPVNRDLYVRAGGAAVTKVGRVLTESGALQQPETTYLNAGQKVRYTINPRLTGLTTGVPEGYEDLVIPNVQVSDCLPANVIASTLDFALLDSTKWQVTETTADGCTGGRTLVTFRFLEDAEYADPLAPIVFDVRTSLVAPIGSAFDNTVSVRADGVFAANGGAAASATARMYASQLNVAQFEKSTSTPIIERGQRASYKVTWFNFLSSTRGQSTFVDVLPYNGDFRGTDVTGAVTLHSASVDAHAATGAVLELTTDPAIRSASMSAAPANGVTWVAYASATPEQIASATALRVSISNLLNGPNSVGSLNYELNVPDGMNGDTLQNTASGSLLGGLTTLGAGTPVAVEIQSSALSGVVWEDSDDSKTRNTGEAVLPNVTVRLMQGGTAVQSTMTGTDGGYTFDALVSGDYTIEVDPATLYATDGGWKNTVAPNGGAESVSGTISLAAGTSLSDRDFGYRNQIPGISLEKTGVVPSTVAEGELVEWSFTVRNTGNTTLTDVDVIDDLPGVSEISFEEWPNPDAPGVLPEGTQVRATATSPLTQSQIDAGFVTNPATADGDADLPAREVRDDDEATVNLAADPAISLTKTAALTSGADATTAAVGDEVTYTFTIQNTGNVTLAGIALSDELPGLSDVVYGAWPGDEYVLAPNDVVVATATLQLTQAHIDARSVANEATVAGTAPDETPVTDSDGVVLPFDATPQIEVSKTGTLSADGSKINYTILATNTGNVTLHGVEISDELAGLSELTLTWPGGGGVLAPGESVEARAFLLITDEMRGEAVENRATVTGSTGDGDEVTDEDTAIVEVPAAVPPAPVEPGKPGTPAAPTNPLATTGGATLAGVAGLAVLLLLGGAVLIVLRRRRRES